MYERTVEVNLQILMKVYVYKFYFKNEGGRGVRGCTTKGSQEVESFVVLVGRWVDIQEILD